MDSSALEKIIATAGLNDNVYKICENPPQLQVLAFINQCLAGNLKLGLISAVTEFAFENTSNI